MGDAALLGGRDLVGTDVEAPIDGRGIAADDLPAEAFGQRDAERALPCCRGTDDGDEQWVDQGQSRRAAAYNASAVKARKRPTCCARVGTLTGILRR
jgi:hypothetical protein